MKLSRLCKIFLGSVLIWSGSAFAQQSDPGAGLSFAAPEQYQSIPLASNPFSGSDLPDSVDLSRSMPLPGHQGNQNSCVGWAVAYALKTYHEKLEVTWHLETAQGQPHPDRVFSPSFIYNQINNGRDGGAFFTDAFAVLSDQGAAPWSAMPYTAYDTAIPASAKQRARPYRIDTWRRVNVQDLRELKAQLNAGFPVVIGAAIDDGFYSLGSGQIWQSTIGASRGGHAMVVVGYDDARNAFKLINSWGTDWADDGYGWVDYSHFRQVVREAYIVQDAKNGSPPSTPDFEPQDNPYTPPAPSGGNSNIMITQFVHNQFNPANPGLGPGAMVAGTISIPPGVQGYAQIVINLTFQNGMPVQSLSPAFALPNGQAASGTPPLPLDGAGVNTTWFAFLPYCTLNVPKGQLCLPFPQGPLQRSSLIARTVLFVNDFGVAEGPQVPFFLAL